MMFYKETNFKETPIGKIPKDWEVVMFSDVVNTLPGFAFSSKFFSKEKGIPLIRIRDLGKDSTETFYNGPYEEEYLVEKGDILVSMDGEFNVCLWKGPSGLLNQRVMKIWPKCKEKLDALYLYYGSQKPLKSFEYQIAATTVKHLLTEHFRLIKIPLPTEIKEQQKIAEILSTVDEAIQKTNEIIAKTERLKKGLMQELLTKGIGHKESKDTEIGRIPKEWEVVSLENVSLKIRTGPFGSQLRKSELSESGIKVYTQENILKNDFSLGNSYVSYEKFERLKSMEVEPGDVLLTIRGSTGCSAVFPEGAERGIIHTNLAYVRVKRSLLVPKYLSLLINDYPFVKSQVITLSSATTLGALYAKSIRKIKIPLPPLQEQLKIAEILSIVGKKLEIERNQKAKLERIKQRLMDLLLTGKIRVKVN